MCKELADTGDSSVKQTPPWQTRIGGIKNRIRPLLSIVALDHTPNNRIGDLFGKHT